MDDHLARLLANPWFRLGTLVCVVYFLALGSISHRPQAAALVGAICYAYFIFVCLLLTRP